MLSLVLSFTKFYHLFLLNSHSNFVSSILTSTPNNTIASRFHNFQRGYESILGYSNEVPNIYTVRSFSVFSKTFFDLFVEKYIDYFLFNRLNLIY